MTDALDIAALETLEAAATKAPWDASFASNCSVVKQDDNFLFGPSRWPICVLAQVNGYPKDGSGLVASALSDKDQEFISALRNAAPALIAAAKERDGLINLLSDAEVNRVVVRLGEANGYTDTLEAELDSLRAKLEQAGRALTFGKTFGERLRQLSAPDCECPICTTDDEELRAISAALAAIHEKADGKWDGRIAPCPTCGFHVETVQHAPTFTIEE